MVYYRLYTFFQPENPAPPVDNASMPPSHPQAPMNQMHPPPMNMPPPQMGMPTMQHYSYPQVALYTFLEMFFSARDASTWLS